MANLKMAVSGVCVFVFMVLSTVDCQRSRGPRMRIIPRQSQAETLSLPSNATSIREDITDNFSCENKTYGYYADPDNDCQIFHVCLPVTYADGKNQTFRWSFICPESTVFNQENFVCVREEDMTIKCEDSEEYYNLNDNFGNKEETESDVENAEMENSDNPENSANSIDANPSEDMANNDMMGDSAAPEQNMEAGKNDEDLSVKKETADAKTMKEMADRIDSFSIKFDSYFDYCNRSYVYFEWQSIVNI